VLEDGHICKARDLLAVSGPRVHGYVCMWANIIPPVKT